MPDAPLELTPVRFPFALTTANHNTTKQERIEEEKYIRQKEHEDYLKRRAEQVDEEAAKARDEAQKAHDDAMHETIDELFGVLAKTGDKISDIGVENLALWKLGKK